MTAWGNFLLDHPWAFLILLGVIVGSAAGVAVLGAVLLSRREPELSREAEALRSLRGMHPGPRSIP